MSGVPSGASVLATLVRVTLVRLLRGRAVWVSVLIALLPTILAGALQTTRHTAEPIMLVATLVMAVLPPMFIASSVGEEIEDRTTTYLWSRPLARWTMIVAKVVALAPVAVVLVVAGTYVAFQIEGGSVPVRFALATGAGAIAISMMSAAIATLVPKHGMALSLIYLVVFDLPLGALPASISHLSISHHVAQIAEPGGSPGQGVITLAVIAMSWLVIAFLRIRRLES
jgi:ABC-type transport system involved in multi-copper enzyme maturation permease subunit